MAAIFQTTFPNAFSSMKTYEFRLRIHWGLFLRVRVINILALDQIMAWRRPGDKLLCEPMLFSLLTHICVTQPQWVNSTNALDAYNGVAKTSLFIVGSSLMSIRSNGVGIQTEARRPSDNIITTLSWHWWYYQLYFGYIWRNKILFRCFFPSNMSWYRLIDWLNS